MKVKSSVLTSVGKLVILAVTLAALSYLLYFHRLHTLLPGYSAAEVAAYEHSLNWHTIADNIASASWYAVLWVGTGLTHHGIGSTRIVSACMGIVAVAIFFFIARLRYSYWVALLGTLLFATSAGFLHAARLGTPLVLQFGILAFLGAVLWYRKAEHHRILLGYGIAALLGTLLYIPGMIWFELFGVVLMFAGIRRQLRDTASGHTVGWASVFFVSTLPLLYFGALHPHALLEVAGLPQNMGDLSRVGSNLLNSVMSIAVRSNGDPSLWVGHAPLLNVIELALGLIGAYVYLYQLRGKRAVFLAGSLLLGIILASLGGSVTIMCIVPILYMFVVEGADNLMSQWTTVFPRNPFAKTVGVVFICAMLFFSVLYQTRAYFVAWPNNRETKQTFSHHQ